MKNDYSCPEINTKIYPKTHQDVMVDFEGGTDLDFGYGGT